MDRIKIKEFSRELIKGNVKWQVLVALLVNVLIGALPVVLDFLPGSKAATICGVILSLIAILVIMPIDVGICVYLLKLIRTKESNLGDIFTRFNQFVQIFLCNLITGFQIALGCIVIVPGIIWAYKYSQINNVFADNPDISWVDARKKSAELMDGHKLDYFVFELSFFGWYLLVCITCGIALLYVAPYFSVATTKYYDELKALNESKNIEENSQNVEEAPIDGVVEG